MTLERPDDAALARRMIADITPARVFRGRSGTSYPTSLLLALRADHAAARDAVIAPLDLEEPALQQLLSDHDVIRLRSAAPDLATYLRFPGLGRSLSDDSAATLVEQGTRGADVQVVVGDGLSSTAVRQQLPVVLPGVLQGCADRGLGLARPLLVEHCRVGVVNQIGSLLEPRVVVLLIGERPGLATATSLSAYFAHAPRLGDTDAQRNLISNIHDQGVRPAEAVRRIVAMVGRLLEAGSSGAGIREV